MFRHEGKIIFRQGYTVYFLYDLFRIDHDVRFHFRRRSIFCMRRRSLHTLSDRGRLRPFLLRGHRNGGRICAGRAGRSSEQIRQWRRLNILIGNAQLPSYEVHHMHDGDGLRMRNLRAFFPARFPGRDKRGEFKLKFALLPASFIRSRLVLSAVIDRNGGKIQ